MESKYITISKAANLIGVTAKTLRQWEREGKIKSYRTNGGHRRYLSSDLIKGNHAADKITIGYARVSTPNQKADLDRQIELLGLWCASNGYVCEIISDIGSGLNYKKKGLLRLLSLICSGKVERLVLVNDDRLLRFGGELVYSLCEIFGVETIIMNKTQSQTKEEELTQDILEIITVFSARLYGSRSHKNKQLIQELKNFNV